MSFMCLWFIFPQFVKTGRQSCSLTSQKAYHSWRSVPSIPFLLDSAGSQVLSFHWMHYLPNTLNSKVGHQSPPLSLSKEILQPGPEKRGPLIPVISQDRESTTVMLNRFEHEPWIHSGWKAQNWTQGSWVWVTMVMEQHHPEFSSHGH